jgi:hypothetical protein
LLPKPLGNRFLLFQHPTLTGMEVEFADRVVSGLGQLAGMELERSPKVREQGINVVHNLKAIGTPPGAIEQDGPAAEEWFDVILHFSKTSPDFGSDSRFAPEVWEGRPKRLLIGDASHALATKRMDELNRITGLKNILLGNDSPINEGEGFDRHVQGVNQGLLNLADGLPSGVNQCIGATMNDSNQTLHGISP